MAGMWQYLSGASGAQYRFFFWEIDDRSHFPIILAESTMNNYAFAKEVDGVMLPLLVSWETRAMNEVLHWTNRFPDGATHIGVRKDEDEGLLRWCANDLAAHYSLPH